MALGLAIGLALLAGGCATVSSGDYGRPLDDQNRAAAAVLTGAGLLISGEEITALASRYFGAVELTFENRSPAWVQIDSVALDFGTPEANQAVLLPWGADLDAWERATAQRNRIQVANNYAGNRTANSDSTLEILALGDGLGHANRRGRPAGYAGGAVAASAAAALAAQSLAEAQQDPEAVERFPASHLLNLPIRIPPGLFAKRWVLLYTAEHPLGGCVRSVILGYDTADHRHERVLLTFKSLDSEWLHGACGEAGSGMMSAPPPGTARSLGAGFSRR
jgi:hypothetical protein